jgi:hypothetical protein
MSLPKPTPDRLIVARLGLKFDVDSKATVGSRGNADHGSWVIARGLQSRYACHVMTYAGLAIGKSQSVIAPPVYSGQDGNNGAHIRSDLVSKQQGNNDCGATEQFGTKAPGSGLGLEHCEQGELEFAACVRIRRPGSTEAIFALLVAHMRGENTVKCPKQQKHTCQRMHHSPPDSGAGLA